MGTNYYLITNCCESCGRDTRYHIGKKSTGWQFSFFSPYINGSFLDSWEKWKILLNGNKIVNEYEDSISVEDFITLVEDSKKEIRNHFDYCSITYEDWEGRIKEDEEWKDDDGWSFSSCQFS